MDVVSAHDPLALTIAVCTYNRAALLARMLGSIRSQTRQDFDLLILDDCSTDDTRALCEPLAGGRVRYVRNPTNLGFNANYNQALSLATSSHVLLTHDDDFMDPTFVDYLLPGVGRYPEALLVTTNVRLLQEESTPGQQGDAPTGRLITADALRMTQDTYFAPGEYAAANYGHGLGLYCPTFCFHRRRCLDADIRFDPVGPGSDVLICLRANRAGAIAVLAESRFTVCVHPGQDHASVVNDLTAGYRLERVAVPLVRSDARYAPMGAAAEFNLVYHFAKATTAALLDLPGRPGTPPAGTLTERFAAHLATLPPELVATVFACGRNRVAARLFAPDLPLAAYPRRPAAEWITRTPQLDAHKRRWHLANFDALDRLENLLVMPGGPGRPEFLARRTIVIWGLSYLGLVLAETLRRAGLPVLGFVDRNPQLLAARFHDIPCRSWSDTLALLPPAADESVVFTGVEGALDIDLALELGSESPKVIFRSWRTAVDLLTDATPATHG